MKKHVLIKEISEIIPHLPQSFNNLYEIKLNSKKFRKIKTKENLQIGTASQLVEVLYKPLSKLL